MKQGILLIAVSHPYYGCMAYNLAVSIRANEDVPIALICDERGIAYLNEEQRAVFSEVISYQPTGAGMEAAMQLRLLMPKLTPFDITLSLDVDMAWLPGTPVSPLFDLLAERDITYVNEGYYDLDSMESHYTPGFIGWAQPTAVKEAYALKGKLFGMRGELILFRKNAAVQKLFRTAAGIRKKPLLQPQTLGGAITEEFALNIATNQAGIEPHQPGWQPTYWPLMQGNVVLSVPDMKARGYSALSVGGNSAHHAVKRIYTIIMQLAFEKQGLKHVFALKAKRSTVPERLDS